MVRPDAKYILIRYSGNFQITTQVSPGLLSYSEQYLSCQLASISPNLIGAHRWHFWAPNMGISLNAVSNSFQKFWKFPFFQSAVTLRNGSSIGGLIIEEITTVYLWVVVGFFRRTWLVLQLMGPRSEKGLTSRHWIMVFFLCSRWHQPLAYPLLIYLVPKNTEVDPCRLISPWGNLVYCPWC